MFKTLTKSTNINIKNIDLGLKISSFTLENEIFSPNHDHVKDNAIFKVNLDKPTDLSLDILKNGIVFNEINILLYDIYYFFY